MVKEECLNISPAFFKVSILIEKIQFIVFGLLAGCICGHSASEKTSSRELNASYITASDEISTIFYHRT